jgi:hypothetical protein
MNLSSGEQIQCDPNPSRDVCVARLKCRLGMSVVKTRWEREVSKLNAELHRAAMALLRPDLCLEPADSE